MSLKKNSWIGLCAIIVNVLVWGAAAPIIKHGLFTVVPQVFLFYRFVFVLIITAPLAILMRAQFSSIRSKKDLLIVFLISLLTTPLSLGVLFAGLSYTTASAASIIASSVPLFIMLGSALFLQEKITKKEMIGASIATLGMVVITAETPTQADAINPLLGNLLVLANNFFWTAGVLLMKKYAKTYSPFVFGFSAWIIGAVVMGIYSLFTIREYIVNPILIFGSPALYSILYMAFFGSFIGFTAYQVAQKYLSAAETSIFTYLQPAIALPISFLWLKEHMNIPTTLGAIFLVFGVLIAELHPHSRLTRLRKKRTGKRP